MTTPTLTVTIEQELQHAISNGPAAIAPDLLQRAMDELRRMREQLQQPARTGCDDCLDARRQAEAAVQQMTALLSQAEASATYFDRKSLRLEAELQRTTEERDSLLHKDDVQGAAEIRRLIREANQSRERAVTAEAALNDLLAQQHQLAPYVQHQESCALRKGRHFYGVWLCEGESCTCGLAALIDRSRQGAEAPKEQN